MKMLPVSAIVPTLDRPGPLERALESLLRQDALPAEIIIVDASRGAGTRETVARLTERFPASCALRWVPAQQRGAAVQRNQGCAIASQPVLWFFDDDVVFEADCLEDLWNALESDAEMGGVNALITNQRYKSPGAVTRFVYAVLDGKRADSYAGRVLGPAVNVLPDDSDAVPEIARVEWLNTGCTLYRREALPTPPFDSVFIGYSMMEDLALSLKVARRWKLASVRTAKIFHDSQPGTYKSDEKRLSRMELVNRHYVMTQILGRRGCCDYARLFLWETFQVIVAAVNNRLRRPFWSTLAGKLSALREIATR